MRHPLGGAIQDTVVTSGSIFLITGRHILGRFMAVSGIPRTFTEFQEVADTGPIGLMLLVLVLYLVLPHVRNERLAARCIVRCHHEWTG